MLHHRRRHDPPTATIYHGTNAECPNVRTGLWSRCPGHTHLAALGPPLVPEEGALEHLRNALAILRCTLDFGEPVFGSGDGPGVVVRVADLARLQARIEAALGLLALDGRAICLTCGLPFGTPEELARHAQQHGHGRTLASDLQEDR